MAGPQEQRLIWSCACGSAIYFRGKEQFQTRSPNIAACITMRWKPQTKLVETAKSTSTIWKIFCRKCSRSSWSPFMKTPADSQDSAEPRNTITISLLLVRNQHHVRPEIPSRHRHRIPIRRPRKSPNPVLRKMCQLPPCGPRAAVREIHRLLPQVRHIILRHDVHHAD